FWFPKMFGRQLNETWGKVHFATTFLFSNGVFYPMHILGTGGHMRRIFDPEQYSFLRPLMPVNQFMSVSVLLLGLVQIIFIVNIIYSLFYGQRVGRNPWRCNSLEWAAPSPPPHGNFEMLPIVYRGPYEYSAPEMQGDYWPQTLPPGEHVPNDDTLAPKEQVEK